MNGKLRHDGLKAYDIQLHSSTTMSPGNERKPIKHAEITLLKRAAIIGYWWYSKGSAGDGRPHHIAIAAVFGMAQQTISDVIRMAKLRARESLADR